MDTLLGLVRVVLGCISKSYLVTAKAATFISRRGSGSTYLVEFIPCLSCTNVRAFNANIDPFIYLPLECHCNKDRLLVSFEATR